MSDTTSTESTSDETVEPVKLSLKSLDTRVAALESVEPAEVPNYEEQFQDLLAGVIESLVRTRSSGARQVALKLKDKYLDEDVDLMDFGEQFVTRESLYSGGKAE